MKAGKAEIAWVLGGRLVAAVGALASIKIITQYLSVAEMGIFGLALAVANGTAKSAFNPLSQPMLRFSGSALQEKDFPVLLASFCRAYLMILIAVGLLAAAILFWGFDFLGARELILAVLIACCIGLQTGNVGMMSSMRWRRATAISQASVAWGRGLLAIPLMMMFGARPEVALFGYLCALLICVGWQTRTILVGTGTTFRAAFDARGDRAEWSRFVTYTAPFFIMFGIDAAASEIDKVIVAAYFSSVELGAYVAMQLLARMPVFFVVGLVEQLVYPIFFQGSRKVEQSGLTAGSFRTIIRIYLVILAGLAVLCVGVYLMREPLVRLLTTADYVPYAMLLPLLMFAGVIAQSARILQAPALKAIGSRVFVPAKVVQLIVLVGVMVAAIPAYGLYGVAIAANVASLALVTSIIATNLYHIKRGVPAGSPDND